MFKLYWLAKRRFIINEPAFGSFTIFTGFFYDDDESVKPWLRVISSEADDDPRIAPPVFTQHRSPSLAPCAPLLHGSTWPGEDLASPSPGSRTPPTPSSPRSDPASSAHGLLRLAASRSNSLSGLMAASAQRTCAAIAGSVPRSAALKTPPDYVFRSPGFIAPVALAVRGPYDPEMLGA